MQEANGTTPGKGRRPRADGQRNRERLMATAREMFAARRGEVTLTAVAEAAGVGIGTLYRHFPTRDALVEAIYRKEVEQLCAAVPELLAAGPPFAALADWLDRYMELVATKYGLKEAVRSIFEPGGEIYAYSRAAVRAAIGELLAAAAAAGAIRPDHDPDDLLLSIAASTWALVGDGDWRPRARRLMQLTLDGLRYRAPSPP